jgi:hypothetical protein
LRHFVPRTDARSSGPREIGSFGGFEECIVGEEPAGGTEGEDVGAPESGRCLEGGERDHDFGVGRDGVGMCGGGDLDGRGGHAGYVGDGRVEAQGFILGTVSLDFITVGAYSGVIGVTMVTGESICSV